MQRDLSKGEAVVFRFPFECTLGPGSYSVTTGLTATDTHLTDNFEWSDNLFVFDVVNVDKPIFIGNVWLEGQFSIRYKNR
jgi:lipopolysaccharide transport system ATP-binding protein